ncbi:hypothetical protein BDW22DRAFT_381428 [Trametopsis cervina]|nr:hypothetical protein BDW22DRAFT_381428 [Trametopsis cervina]
MTTAQGSVASVNSKFTATFIIDEIPFTYSTTVAISVQNFQAVATLTFTTKDQLTGTRTYNGQLGQNALTLNLANGPKISGPLVPPIIPASNINGTGAWTQG